MRRLVLLVTVLALPLSLLAAQAEPILIKAGHLIDGRADQARSDIGILVDGRRITAVGPVAQIQSQAGGARVIDLSPMTVLPGPDRRPHPPAAAGRLDQRSLRRAAAGAVDRRTARSWRRATRALSLLHGFTAAARRRDRGRDVRRRGREAGGGSRRGAGAADLRLDPRHGADRDVPILHTTTGSSSCRTGCRPVDGVEGARLAVREQVSHGADWIKYYADRRYYFTRGLACCAAGSTSPTRRRRPSWTRRTASGRRVAAHAIGSDGIAAALRAGVNSIEHGDGMTDSLMDVMIRRNVYWVPTVTVGALCGGPARRHLEADGGPPARAFRRAVRKGVKIVMGTDVGGFPWTEINQAKEFEYYVQYGMTPMQAIKSGTSLAAELLGAGRTTSGSHRARTVRGHRGRGGRSAQGHHRTAAGAFVMKGGTVYLAP